MRRATKLSISASWRSDIEIKMNLVVATAFE